MRRKYHQNAVELATNFEKLFKDPKSYIAEKEAKARKALLPTVKTVLFCGRQGIALRGHDESSKILTNAVQNSASH